MHPKSLWWKLQKSLKIYEILITTENPVRYFWSDLPFHWLHIVSVSVTKADFLKLFPGQVRWHIHGNASLDGS